MNQALVLLLLGISLTVLSCSSRPPLPTGRNLAASAAAEGQELGSLPVNMVLSPDGRFAITTNAGHREALWSIDVATGKGISRQSYSSRSDPTTSWQQFQEHASEIHSRGSNGLYYGLAIAQDGTVYAAQGAYDAVAVLSLAQDGTLVRRGSIATRARDFPAGVAVDKRGMLYVANQSLGLDNPFASAGSVAIYDRNTGREVGRSSFTDSYAGTSNYLLAIVARPEGDKVYVASERDNAVYVLDVREPARPQLLSKIVVGTHPQALLLNRDASKLYVANADSDTVSVIDCATSSVAKTVLLRPAVARELPGCSPTNLALSAAEDTLYVTLGDLNAIAIVDLASAQVRGYMPANWYPTAIAAAPDGKRLLVTCAKGIEPRHANAGANPKTGKRSQVGSPLVLTEGRIQLLDIPDAKELAEITEQVLRNNRLDDPAWLKANPLASIGIRSGKITHVIYIVKENRTYDQVLGDMGEGNGDPELCIFGREVTANQHALAKRFVLLDNLYACGEVSGDGWCWSTQAIANAHVARNVPYHYSSRGRRYDYEGQNNGYPTGGLPATAPDGKPIALHPALRNGAPPVPDVAESEGGYLWDVCAKRGISFRNFGFFTYSSDKETGLPGGPENYPAARGLQPGGHDLAGVTDLDFRGFDMRYADSDAPEMYYKETGDARYLFPTRTYGQHNAPSRFSEWNREFQQMLAKNKDDGGRMKDETSSGIPHPSSFPSAVPQLMFVRLPTDHTVGARSMAHSPRSHAADNDYAVGQLVEAVSRSPIWEHCAIFIIEDDAQAGPDHVDSHRTTGYVISPYIRANSVDHRFYNTNSFLRTMELLLELPPMTQYDATASPILDWTDEPLNKSSFTAILPSKELIGQRNPHPKELPEHDPEAQMARQSEQMDFSHADAAPAGLLNDIIWKTVKGKDARPPQSTNTCPFYQRPEPDDDD